MNIFLTGATGFVGTRLASDLLKEGHTLYLLVRNMKKASSFLTHFEEVDHARLHFIEGNLDNESLNINEDEIQSLTESIDAIYHSAALLSFDPNMGEETFKVNVDGTKNVIEFSLRISCPRFLYVSTAYTVGMETEGAESLYNVNRAFVNYYEQSKCHSEHLVMSYKNQMEVMILRPSIIVGDSKTGKAETSFGLYGLLKATAILKRKIMRQPELQQNTYHLLLDKNVRTNLVPVDYVCNVMKIALTHGENGKIYHITNPSPLTQGEILEIIKDVLQFPNLECISYEEETTLSALERSFNDSLSIFKNYLSREVHFPYHHTEDMLNKAGEKVVHFGKEEFRTIIKGFLQKN